MSVFDIRRGDKISGKYVNGAEVSGTVRDFRMRGFEMIFYVDLDVPIMVYGRERTSVVLSEKELDLLPA